MNDEETIHEIDLAKAADTDHAQFFIRLMWSLNDMLALRYLQSLNKPLAEKGDPLAVSSLMYTIKMASGHIYEAVSSLVISLAPRKNKKHVIYQWIEKQPGLMELFNTVLALSKGGDFDNLCKIRNAFVFHYNYSDGSKVTVNALNQRVAELKKLSEKPIGQIFLSPSREEYRFLIADDVMSAAWRSLTNVPFAQDYSNVPESVAQVDYRNALGEAYVRFADTCIIRWIESNGLATGDTAIFYQDDGEQA